MTAQAVPDIRCPKCKEAYTVHLADCESCDGMGVVYQQGWVPDTEPAWPCYPCASTGKIKQPMCRCTKRFTEEEE